MVDDAHASGVLGRNGRGTVDHFDLHGRVDIQVGTLSKAIGVMGGYIAGRQHLKDYLIQRCRPFLFSTSQPPAVAAACIAAIDVLEQEPERIERLWDNTRFFKAGLQRARLRHRHQRDAHHAGHGGRRGQGAAARRAAVRAGRLRHVRGLPDRRAGQGARAHDRDERAHARRPAARASTRSRRWAASCASSERRIALNRRWVCLDVGETLIDETRIWSIWADVLGVPRLTFMAAFGAAVARGGEHHDVFAIVGRPDWRDLMPRVLDALTADSRSRTCTPTRCRHSQALREAGYRVAIIANQPAERTAELRALGFDADVIAMSDEMGVHKPDPAFFDERLRLMGDPDPADVAYVGDRPDNDVKPSAAAGMRAVWLRRGPWGVIWDEAPEAALTVYSLTELVDRLDEVVGDGGGRRVKLTIVGPASAYSSKPGRASSCYLVEHEDTAIALDLGQGSFSELWRYRSPGTLAAIVISHMHADHNVDLVPLRHWVKFANRGKGPQLFGPTDLASALSTPSRSIRTSSTT